MEENIKRILGNEDELAAAQIAWELAESGVDARLSEVISTLRSMEDRKVVFVRNDFFRRYYSLSDDNDGTRYRFLVPKFA